MKRRIIGFAVWMLLAACLYFFENNTGTRIVLCSSLLMPLVPFLRSMFFREAVHASPDVKSVEDRTFSLREEEEPGDIRPYLPGDPVSRIHWKLSAKKRELLVRKDASAHFPDEDHALLPAQDLSDARPTGGKRAFLLFFFLLPLIALLFLVPPLRQSFLALANRLFDASEAANAYLYPRFSVPSGQSTLGALLILSLALALLLLILILSGSRLMGLCLMALCVLFQVYFGLSLPGWAQVLLFTLFALWSAPPPLTLRKAGSLLGTLLALSLLVVILIPGVDQATESASEQVRDFLSRISGSLSASVSETPPGEHETRHVFTQTLTEGKGEAQQEKTFRLQTSLQQQISQPQWINYLKIILLLLATAAALILPFLPFMWLERRRKKALKEREAFDSENVSEAVCAIFRHVISWLEAVGHGAGNLSYRDWAERLPADLPDGYPERFSACARIYEEAAYSSHLLDESSRQSVLSLLEETRNHLLARADWKEKARLKYGECLWM